MSYEGYNLLKIRTDRGVAFVTIDNPPINLLTLELAEELQRFTVEIAADNAVKVVVFDSANPDYFIAHFDVSVLVELPDEIPPKSADLHGLDQIHEMFRRMPKVSIAKIDRT